MEASTVQSTLQISSIPIAHNQLAPQMMNQEDHYGQGGVVTTTLSLGIPSTSNSTIKTSRRRSGKCSGQESGAPQSQFKGVYYVLGGRWESKITYQSKTRHIGTYDTELEAAFAFDTKAHELGVSHRANFLYDNEGNIISSQVSENHAITNNRACKRTTSLNKREERVLPNNQQFPQFPQQQSSAMAQLEQQTAQAVAYANQMQQAHAMARAHLMRQEQAQQQVQEKQSQEKKEQGGQHTTSCGALQSMPGHTDGNVYPLRPLPRYRSLQGHLPWHADPRYSQPFADEAAWDYGDYTQPVVMIPLPCAKRRRRGPMPIMTTTNSAHAAQVAQQQAQAAVVTAHQQYHQYISAQNQKLRQHQLQQQKLASQIVEQENKESGANVQGAQGTNNNHKWGAMPVLWDAVDALDGASPRHLIDQNSNNQAVAPTVAAAVTHTKIAAPQQHVHAEQTPPTAQKKSAFVPYSKQGKSISHNNGHAIHDDPLLPLQGDTSAEIEQRTTILSPPVEIVQERAFAIQVPPAPIPKDELDKFEASAELQQQVEADEELIEGPSLPSS
mmetsp:Transcript_2163/g.3359  ORF Transcript_2163/g.3359 Transcript_2163/m.3359 type:complete len:556 (-) Transcript_2163:528-2195(-)